MHVYVASTMIRVIIFKDHNIASESSIVGSEDTPVSYTSFKTEITTVYITIYPE